MTRQSAKQSAQRVHIVFFSHVSVYPFMRGSDKSDAIPREIEFVKS